MKRKYLLLFTIPIFLLSSCQQSTPPPVKETKKVSPGKELCSKAEEFLPKGNHTVVYQKFKYSSCRVVAFYPPGEAERLWYNLTIYKGMDGKVYAVYGVYVNPGGKLFVDKDEAEAINRFKEEYYSKLIKQSIKMLKDFQKLAEVGKGEPAYFLVWREEWENEKIRKEILKQLEDIAKMTGLKIEILTPKPDTEIIFKFKLPFHQVFLIKGDRVIRTRYYIDVERLREKLFQPQSFNASTSPLSAPGGGFPPYQPQSP